MNIMRYKEYGARIEYSDEDGCFIGRIEGIRDVVGFHGDTVEGLRAAFQEAVDDYLATCLKLGRPPDRAYSGRLLLRIPGEVHARVARKAMDEGKSLNQWAAETLASAT